MKRFDNDYAEGAHEAILEQLVKTNYVQAPGYGTDKYCEQASKYIKNACDAINADVHFLVGGTQTNTIMIASVLRPHQGVIAATNGHIAVHETGAIEAIGHKVITCISENGKLTSDQIKHVFDEHWNDVTHEHTVQPGAVYISHPTENGTTYTKKELEELSLICRQCQLPLIMDGARLGYGLAVPGNDLSLVDIAKLCDMFYIGGTKVGALCGEALVIINSKYKKDFRYLMKQKGGLLAKGRLLGIQFATLFENNLYFTISQHAVSLALRIQKAFLEKGFSLRYDSMSNQQFIILPDDVISVLQKKYSFALWEKYSNNEVVVRFCTSWATKPEDVEELIEDIYKL